MRKKFPEKLNKYRVVKGTFASDDSFEFNGAFLIPYGREVLRIIISDQLGWDHVSVSCIDRTPIWAEMCFAKDLFFDEEEIVVQYHPAKKEYVNDHPYVLHLWRPHHQGYPMPSAFMV